MRGVREDGDRLVIGAATTHDEVLRDPLGATHCPVIAEVTETVADPAVRHRGTFGGSIAHADPAGDLPALALALDASMEVAGSGGRRTVAAGEFFVDYLQTAVRPGRGARCRCRSRSWATGGATGTRSSTWWRRRGPLVGVVALVERSNGDDRRRPGRPGQHGTDTRFEPARSSRRWWVRPPRPQAVAAAAGSAGEGDQSVQRRRRRRPTTGPTWPRY